MGCSCNKKNKEVNLETIIEPFDTCLYCAFKHISYSLVLLKTEETPIRALSQLYLAFKHLEKKYDELSKEIFDVIFYFFKNLNLDDKKILNISLKIQKEIKNENEDEIKEHSCLNLEEKKLFNEHLKFLYLAVVQELYEYEVGYEKINSPWIMGLLQRASENADYNDKDEIRRIWKNYEVKNILIPEYFSFLNLQYKKIVQFIESLNK